jgi:predicted nucleic acid-binding Zn ribbon protein
MIVINFECNACGSKDGQLDMLLDEPIIFCRKCEEHEPIKDYDIVGHGTEID